MSSRPSLQHTRQPSFQLPASPRSSSLPFPNIPPPTPSPAAVPNPRADQILHRFFNKVSLVISNARLTTEGSDSLDTAAPTTLALSASAGATAAGGTSSASSSVVLGVAGASPSPAAGSKSGGRSKSGPKVDKWFNLETPDSEAFKSNLQVYKSISTTFPIAPSHIAVPVPALRVSILLSIPHTSNNQVLVLTLSDHRIRIDPTPRHILLESWRVSLTRPSTMGSTTSSISSSSTASLSEVELPTVYKQSIALFRSMYTLLRTLPAGKLQKRLRRRTRTGLGGGLALEMKVDVEKTYDDTSSDEERIGGDRVQWPIVGFDTPLSQDPSANTTEAFSFPHIASPLGYLNVSVTYRTQTNFTLDSLESLLSSGFFTADQRQYELYSNPPIPPPNYPLPPYPPVAGALTQEEDEKERGKQGLSPVNAEKDKEFLRQKELERQKEMEREEKEFEVVGGFTPTVVVEERRRRESAASTAPLSTSPLNSLPIRTRLPRSPPSTTIGLSNRVHPASLPRERTIMQANPSHGWDGERDSPATSTYSSSFGLAGGQNAVASGSSQPPSRSRFNSIPVSSSPLGNSPYVSTQRTQLPGLQAINTSHRDDRSSLGVASTSGNATAPLMHARTISMPSSASRTYVTIATGPGSGTGATTPVTGTRFAFPRAEDLPFASAAASRAGSGNGTTIRRRIDSTTGNVNPSISGIGGERSSLSLFPGGREGPLSPSSAAFPQLAGTPGSFKDHSPAPGTPLSLSRKPSITPIQPFKSATLSSSPSAHPPLGTSLRQQSPMSERPPGGFGLPLIGTSSQQQGVAGSFGSRSQQPPAIGSYSSRSPLQAPGSVGRATALQYGSFSPSSTPGSVDTRDKRGSFGSSDGVAPSGRRMTYSPDNLPTGTATGGAIGIPGAPAMKRYSSSFSHRYAGPPGTSTSVGTPPGIVGAGVGAGIVGSAGSGGSGRGGGLGLAGIPGRNEDKSFLSAATDDDEISAFVRAIDARPQLRNGGGLQRLSPSNNSSTSSPGPVGKVLSDISEVRHPEDSEPSLSSVPHTRQGTMDGSTSSAGGPFVSAVESVGNDRSRPSTIHEGGDASSSPVAPRGTRAVMLTSRADVDEKIRRMTEDFARGMDKVTEVRRQQQERRDTLTSSTATGDVLESDDAGSTSTGVQASPRFGGSSAIGRGSPRARGVYRMLARERTDSQSSFGGASSGMARRTGSAGTFEEAFGRME